MRVRKQIMHRATRWAKSPRAIATIFCLPVIAIALGLVASTPVAAQNLVRLDIMGGSGGSNFEHICGTGRVLVGVRGYTGVWIDNVQAICAKAEANGVSDTQPEGRVFGGDRLLISRTECSNGTVVAGLELSNNSDKPFLGRIKSLCTQLWSRDRLAEAAEMRGSGRLDAEPDRSIGANFTIAPSRQECPAGTVAVGIRGRAGLFLDALGLVCGSKSSPPPSFNLANFLGKQFSFQSVNFPDRYIRHRNSLGYIEPIPDLLARKDATFKLVSGLAGRCASFESQNYPDHFLRHQGFRLKLAKRTDDPLFREDATFCPGSALGESGVSFESANLADHFIRHSRFELWVHRYDRSEQFRKDATFKIAPPGYASETMGRSEINSPRLERTERPTQPSRPVPPFIIANPADVIIAYGQTVGKTTLTWDGGKNHLYAEVWIKIDNGDATFLVEQGKGTREVTIEPHKTYLFILTDAGQQLATVTVRVRTP